MRIRARVNDRPVEVSLTPAAEAALAARDRPLLVEMELYFSCLIRKRVRFRDGGDGGEAGEPGATAVTDRLRLRFRPVMTARCGRDYEGVEPPLTDFPIHEAARFVPRRLHIDHDRQGWHGEFSLT